mmetsp:Transcript_19633/g.29254  ORF Transcript_19633/g.29254 Transcript_19633/m.29254 type:complete len:111 (+) Transcript_19633:195-527(+)
MSNNNEIVHVTVRDVVIEQKEGASSKTTFTFKYTPYAPHLAEVAAKEIVKRFPSIDSEADIRLMYKVGPNQYKGFNTGINQYAVWIHDNGVQKIELAFVRRLRATNQSSK